MAAIHLGPYTYSPDSFGPDDSLLMFETTDDSTSVVMARQDWEVIGSPDTITITITPAEEENIDEVHVEADHD